MGQEGIYLFPDFNIRHAEFQVRGVFYNLIVMDLEISDAIGRV